MAKWVSKHALVVCFLLSLLISWSVEFLLILSLHGWITSPIPMALHYLASFGPMLAAFISFCIILLAIRIIKVHKGETLSESEKQCI